MHYQTRRSVLASVIGSTLWSAGVAAALPVSEDLGLVPDLPDNLRQYKDRSDLNRDLLARYDAAVKGLEPALLAERKTAIAIIQDAPSFTSTTSPAPIDIARYFLSIAQDRGEKFPQDWPSYMRAWPFRANPLIVEFFTATGTKPSGDMTAWCSAFMNWCFLRARAGRPDASKMLKPTNSAASASWRKWGKGIVYDEGQSVPKNGTPQVGNIVVFVDRADADHGHVCFFVAQEGARLRVVGGNQLEGKPTRHVVSEKLLPLWGSVLRIHSIRTDPDLRPTKI